MKNCSHKDKNGNSFIDGDMCTRCGENFGPKFLNKQKNKGKRDKKNSDKKSDWEV